MSTTHLVTGAFGYTGRYLASALLARSHHVRTLTNSPGRTHPFGDRVSVYPMCFESPDRLAEAFVGVHAFYNTYWVRFSRSGFSQEEAVRNTLMLFEAARDAGVTRIVHVSITNPSEDSPFEYFRCKARLERSLRELGVSHAILRPTVIFGPEDILINNIAWILRRFPVFGMFGRGDYRLQPIHVEDLVALAVREGERNANVTIDAIGPETFTYRELVKVLARAVGKRRLILPLPRRVGMMLGRVMGWFLGDQLVTPEEIDALMDDLLFTASPPAGSVRLSAWARTHAETLGRRYASELARRRDRTADYLAASEC